MTSATADTRAVEQEKTVRDRAIDACRQAAHLSHEAQLLKSLATDAVDDGVHAAKRAIESIRRGVEELGDLKEEAVHRVRRQPFKAVGVALGVGLVLGLAVGWIGWRLGHRE
jgi:ElaB/YqjD/DUF883 family membrane-anchored ribosome-binding protein